MVRHVPALSIAMSVAWLLAQPASAETVTIGIGTQDTTTNTVTAGVVIRQLHLLEKYLPSDGKYANIKFELEWQNFTSGPPVTNAMMANKLQFGMMGDYPLIVNGFTFENNPESKSRLIAVAAYSMSGSGNGMVVHKDSPYYDLADLKGKLVSVPFGSAAHGMVLKAMQDRGYASDFFQLVSQSPEVGSTNLQRKRSTRMPTLFRSRSCCRSAALRERSLTASRPICRPFTASWCAPTLRKNIRKLSSPI
jgi:NitT/TauT family transport system substrate-binding protein